ncbi:Alanine--tRNA ligase [Frankliniella fusca]|uniref:Alanine--tRNA ligase n=1 Tax=Frankliniella fusca TaxID=407009 RepID=A0AAE1HIT4_9NEOP|nr:Alanine--tRNA ligase [Frankliniella fusca]
MPSKGRKQTVVSRTERSRRGLCKAGEASDQTKITEYYKVLNKYDLVLKENEELHSVVELLNSKISKLGSQDSPIVEDMPVLLKALIESYMENKKNTKMVIDIMISTVKSHCKTASKSVIEGVFRFDELNAYLEERKSPKIVWLSEDGTRIVAGVQYDSTTNQLVGLTPPLDEQGLPKVKAFDATTEDAITNTIKTNRTSNYAYVVMAQPLDNVPAFCLCIFGSNNIFNASQVLDRVKWTVQELKKREIIALGLSADGDSRLLSTMKTLKMSFLNGEIFFYASMNNNDTDDMLLLCVQDCIHTLAKLRNQLLKPRTDENFWPIGQYVISGSFLQILADEKNKFHHKLVPSDLDSKDKMNFRSIQKITDQSVIDALKSLPGAAGTRVFLTVTQGIMQAFLDKSLDPTERVNLMWRGLKREKYKSTANFLTPNTYHCMELSSHSLINVIRLLRNMKRPELIRPWLMDSQPCESF